MVTFGEKPFPRLTCLSIICYTFVVLHNCLCLDKTSLCIDYHVECCKVTVFPFGSMLPNLKGH